MTAPVDPRSDLRRLGLPPGAGPDQLKIAWRRAVAQLHPDRHGQGADRALAEVNAAFQRLQAFHRDHGRLPGVSDGPFTVHAPARPRRGRWMLGAAAAAIAVLLWPPVEAPRPVAPDSEPTPIPTAGVPPPANATPLGRRAERIGIGLSPAEVERLAGPPMFRSEDRWQYGPSEIRFTDGKTSGWYSSPLRPLPVGDLDTFPADTE